MTQQHESLVKKAAPMCRICGTYFDLGGLVDVHHSVSEFPFEFAATIASVLKQKYRGRDTENISLSRGSESRSAPPLKQICAKAQVLKVVLSVASAPAWLLAAATGKKACLNSVIVRKPLLT